MTLCGPRIEWYRALDYPDKYILASGRRSAVPEIAVTIVLTIVTLVYLGFIRGHFAHEDFD